MHAVDKKPFARASLGPFAAGNEPPFVLQHGLGERADSEEPSEEMLLISRQGSDLQLLADIARFKGISQYFLIFCDNIMHAHQENSPN